VVSIMRYRRISSTVSSPSAFQSIRVVVMECRAF
jgi:hypothetical protein